MFGLPGDRECWDDLIDALESGPVLLSIDDAQAIDPRAIAVVGWLLTRFADRPVVALLAFRDPTGLRGASATTLTALGGQVDVEGAPWSSRRLAVAAFVADRGLEAGESLFSIAAIAHGHPGLITELLDETLTAGLTPGEVIAARLSHLSSRTRTTPRCAAMLREVFQHGVHAALLSWYEVGTADIRFRSPFR